MRFIVAAFLIYLGMHAYAFVALGAAFAPGAPAAAGLAAAMALLAFAPVFAHVLDRRGAAVAGRALARAGYLWMGLLFLFVCWGLALDLVAAAAALVRGAGAAALPDPDAHARALAALALTAASALYGAFEARRVRVRRVSVRSARLPAGHPPVRVVQITDLHIGPMTGAGPVRRLATRLAALEPDLLVSTGDLIDGDIPCAQAAAQALAAVPARLGRFAVIGNHEVYAGLEAAAAATRWAGFVLLRDEWRAVGDGLVVAGVDDPAAGGPDREARVFDGLPAGRCTLLLKHRPRVRPASLGRFDVQLSGHTHRGQIFPFGWVVRRAYPARPGLTDLGSGSYLYLSNGTGFWGPPIRFLAPPEIAVIELVPAAQAPAPDGRSPGDGPGPGAGGDA